MKQCRLRHVAQYRPVDTRFKAAPQSTFFNDSLFDRILLLLCFFKSLKLIFF